LGLNMVLLLSYIKAKPRKSPLFVVNQIMKISEDRKM
jgi:hypothetical protein